MGITTLSRSDFDRDSDRAREAALDGPVYITEAGVPGHVLPSIGEYRRLAGEDVSIAELLRMPPGAEDIELDITRPHDLPRPFDFDWVFLVDTNVVSELRKTAPNARVNAWSVSVRRTDLFLSVIVVGELEDGVLRMERRDPVQGAVLRAWLDGQVLPSFAGRILPVDLAVAVRAAILHIPDPRSVQDCLMAATALVHGMTVVTRNVAGFALTGAPVLDPWAHA